MLPPSEFRPMHCQRGRVWLWLALTLTGLGAGGLGGYWYYHPYAAPEWVRERLPGLADVTQPLYKWQDDQGRWQFTDAPPPGRSYQTLSYPRATNVLPSTGQVKDQR